MPRKTKAPPVEDLELDDEDLEDLEDEDEEDVESEDDEDGDVEEDDDEESPPARKAKPKAKAKSKKRKSTDGIGTADLAAALGTDGRSLRIMLRANKVKKDAETKRYHWASVEAALEAMGFDSVDEASEALEESKKERISELKKRTEAKRKKDKKTKAAAEEDDEDEDDEEEDEAPPPKSKKRSKK